MKGMKWGVRKSRPSSGTKRKKKALINITVNKTQKVIAPKSSKKSKSSNVKSMSDEDLRKAVSRLNMEKQYKQLTEKQLSPGRKFVQDVITNAGKETAKKYVSKYMDKGVERLIKEAGDIAKAKKTKTKGSSS